MSKMKNGNRDRGLTRTEVVVVSGCLALLTLVILPALTTARDAGKRAVCLANLKTLGAAALLYARDYEDKIPAWGIEFDEFGSQGDPAADWLTKTTDSLTKGFEYGYIWEYVQNNAPYTCPSLTNKMNPKIHVGMAHGPYVWGWPDGQGTQNPPGPMWSYAVNGQAGRSMNDLSQWRANPELVLPSPTSVMMLYEEDYMGMAAFDNSISLFQAFNNVIQRDDSLGGYHMTSGVITFSRDYYYPKRKGLGNLVYFDGHVGSMDSEEFLTQCSNATGTLELIGGYIDFIWPGF